MSEIEQKTKEMRTLSLIAETAMLDKLYEDLSKLGWRLTYKGHSGSWLAEPIYVVRNLNAGIQSESVSSSESNNEGIENSQESIKKSV